MRQVPILDCRSSCCRFAFGLKLFQQRAVVHCEVGELDEQAGRLVHRVAVHLEAQLPGALRPECSARLSPPPPSNQWCKFTCNPFPVLGLL